MAWNDEPTEAQLDMLWYWLKWNMPTNELRSALAWLKDNKTRKEVSDEMRRVRDLFKRHALTKETLLEADIWADYKGVQDDEQ